MFDLIEMMRPANCGMASLGVLVGWVVTWGLNVNFALPLAMVIAFLITGAGNVINDYLDIESDRINRPKRPIPSGRVSKDAALAFSMILFLAGILISGFINWGVFFIAILNSVILMLYSVSLQDKLLLGNLSIGYLVGSTFLFGGFATGNYAMIVSPLTLFLLAMLSTISREIIKDLEDMEGDRKGFLKKITQNVSKGIAQRFGFGKHGIEMRYSTRFMISLAIASIGIAVILSVLPYYYGIFSMVYLVIVAVADMVFLSCVYSLGMRNKAKSYARISKRMKIGMFIALLAFIAGVLI